MNKIRYKNITSQFRSSLNLKSRDPFTIRHPLLSLATLHSLNRNIKVPTTYQVSKRVLCKQVTIIYWAAISSKHSLIENKMKVLWLTGTHSRLWEMLWTGLSTQPQKINSQLMVTTPHFKEMIRIFLNLTRDFQGKPLHSGQEEVTWWRLLWNKHTLRVRLLSKSMCILSRNSSSFKTTSQYVITWTLRQRTNYCRHQKLLKMKQY